MHKNTFRLIPIFFFSVITFSYAQFDKQILLEVGENSKSSTAYKFVTALDADSDDDIDVIGEISSDDMFNPIYINMNGDLADNVPGWNNLQQVPNAGVSFPLIDLAGESTGIEITLNTAWNGSGRQGYDSGQEEGIYPNGVTRSYYYTSGTEQISLSGLDPSKQYKFTFYASSMYNDDRTTRYRIGSQEVMLNAAKNETQTVSITGVQPNQSGNITLEVGKTSTTKNYAFLGSIIIEPNEVASRQYVLLKNNGTSPFDSTLLVDNTVALSFARSTDLNQDGYDDLLGYDLRSQQLLWYRNQNGGTFARTVVASELPISLQTNEVFELDLNKDGRLDIVMSRGNELYWYQQNSEQTFASGEVWKSLSASETSALSFLTTGDIDGDDLPDIIWQYGTQIHALSSQDYSADQIISVEGVSSPLLLTAADMNSDGLDDLVITETYSWTGTYQVRYLSSSNGTINSTPTSLAITNLELLNQHPQQLIGNDVDQDGDLDFYIRTTSEACGCTAPPQTGWIENQGNWQSAQYHAISAQDIAQWVDVDQDGDQDLIGSRSDQPGLYWTENVDGQWNSVTYQALDQPVIDQINKVILSDINQDTLPDLIVQSTAHIARLNNQQGTSLSPVILRQISASNAAVAFADIDADNIQELFIADNTSQGQTVIQWVESATDASRELITHQGNLSDNSIFLTSGGLLFAPLNETGNKYGWWKRNENGAFALSGTLDGPVTQIAELTGDTFIDVVTENGWYKNTNNTQFQSMSNAKGQQVVDFDGDGDLDVIMIPTSGQVSWYENSGSGSFTLATLSLSAGGTLYFADMDADGDADIIQGTSAGISWRENLNAKGSLGEPVSIDTFVASQLQVADIDADGDNDIIANNSRTLVLFKNTYQKAENTAPVAQTEIEDQTATVDTSYQYQLPPDAFVDNDAGDILTYQATLDDESDLPAWLSFDQNNRSFSGTPVASDTGMITLQVTVTDTEGATASQTFTLTVVSEENPDDGEDPDDDEDPDDGEDPDNGEGPITSIGEEQTQEVVLYPNPVSVGDRIIIKNLSAYEFAEGRMYTAQGKIVRLLMPNDNRANIAIETSSLTPGVYLLEIYTSQQTLRRKVIVK